MQPLLRRPRLAEDGRGVPGAALGQAASEPRRMAVMPTRLDQDAPDGQIAGFRDTPPALPFPGRGLAWHEAEEGHELPRVQEARQIAELGEQDNGGRGVDPAEAAEPADVGAIGGRLGQGGDLAVEGGDPREELLHGEDVFLEGARQDGEGKALGPNPRPVPLGPVPAVAVEAAMAGQELPEPVAPAEELLLDILPAPEEIAPGLARLVRDGDRREIARSEEPHQLADIAAVGLDPIAGFPGCERGGHHLAQHAKGRALAVQLIAGRAGLVADPDVAFAPQALEVAPEVARLIGNRVDLRLLTAGPENANPAGAFAIVNGHKDAILFHDRPPFACGSVPPGTTHVILR